jgi:dihydroorotate dehydrogenase (NAD+) catalytic subunit
MYNFHDPAAMIHVIEEMERFCRETGIRDINEIIGCV